MGAFPIITNWVDGDYQKMGYLLGNAPPLCLHGSTCPEAVVRPASHHQPWRVGLCGVKMDSKRRRLEVYSWHQVRRTMQLARRPVCLMCNVIGVVVNPPCLLTLVVCDRGREGWTAGIYVNVMAQVGTVPMYNQRWAFTPHHASWLVWLWDVGNETSHQSVSTQEFWWCWDWPWRPIIPLHQQHRETYPRCQEIESPSQILGRWLFPLELL